jgi:hypothetical protein
MIWFGLERFFHLVTYSWCVMHWNPQAKGKGERRRAHRCEKEYNVAAMKENCVYTWSGVYSFRRFCWKPFLNWNQTERNGHKHTWIYNLDQLDAGKSVKVVWMCHCLSICHCLSPQMFLLTSVHLQCKLSFIGKVVANSWCIYGTFEYYVVA